jgi:thiamine-phosphate pyrophosphorylase
LVNSRLEVVKAARADGVHLPADGPRVGDARRHLGPGALIGRSCHTKEEVATAAQEGADFAVFGPVWETPGKKPTGMTALHEATKMASLPIFAIGGVTPARAKRALNAGAYGVACIRSILGSENPSAAALEMWQAITG